MSGPGRKEGMTRFSAKSGLNNLVPPVSHDESLQKLMTSVQRSYVPPCYMFGSCVKDAIRVPQAALHKRMLEVLMSQTAGRTCYDFIITLISRSEFEGTYNMKTSQEDLQGP